MDYIKYYRKQLYRLKSLEKEPAISVDLLQYGITKDYYAKFNEAAMLLVEFEHKYLFPHRYYNSLSKVIKDFDDEDIKLCILIDVFCCYEGLDHSTSFLAPEGIALLVLVCRLYGIGCIERYEDLGHVDSTTVAIIDVLPALSECAWELVNCKSLFFSKFIAEENVNIDKLYRLLIYNLCKSIAEVDKVLSSDEYYWLRYIADLNDDDITNDLDLSIFERDEYKGILA